MAEQLTTDGGSEAIQELEFLNRLDTRKPAVHYKRGGVDVFPMLGEADRKKMVRDLFPESEYAWHDDQSILWNWIQAHADRYFEGDYKQAQRMVNDASDPIFGGPNAKDISRFIWTVA